MFEHVLVIKYCFKAYLISGGIRQSDLTNRCHLQVRQREEVIKVKIFQLRIFIFSSEDRCQNLRNRYG